MFSRTLAALSLGLTLALSGVAGASAEVATMPVAGTPATTGSTAKPVAAKPVTAKSAAVKGAKVSKVKVGSHGLARVAHRSRLARISSKRVHLAGRTVKVSHASRHSAFRRV